MKEVEFYSRGVEGEIQFILTSTTESHVANKPGSEEYNNSVDKLYKSIHRSIKRSKELPGDTPSAKMRSTVHYRLAEILKVADSWKEFTEMVAIHLPETKYKDNPRILLKLGGFIWKTRFSVPPKPLVTPKKPKERKKVEAVLETTLKELYDKTCKLEETIDSLIEEVYLFRNIFIKHSHTIEQPNITSKPKIVTVNDAGEAFTHEA